MPTNDIPAVAREKLFTEVWLPSFVKSAQAHGVVFRDEEDVLAAVKVAQALETIEAQQTEQAVQSGQPDTMLKAAALMIDQAVTGQTEQQSAEAEKTAALVNELRSLLFTTAEPAQA